MTGHHTQQFCDSFSRLARSCKGHFAEQFCLLLRAVSMGRRTSWKPFGKNYPFAGRILAPEAADLNQPANVLTRTRQISVSLQQLPPRTSTSAVPIWPLAT